MKSTPAYQTKRVISRDGTIIGYRQLGDGPGLILVHGGMKSSQHFMKLAMLLSDTFSVYIPDRRGRGLSGPFGDDFSVVREAEDLQALLEKTGAHNVFGLSSGALVSLYTSKLTSTIHKLALYEPPLSIAGSAPTNWIPRYDRQVAKGKLVPALITALKGTQSDPVLAKIPRFVVVPLMSLALPFIDKPKGSDDVTMRALIPTQHYDMEIVKNMAGTLNEYRTLQTDILLVGGTKSPAYLQKALDALEAALPHSQRTTFRGLGHDGPEDDGKPELVAPVLKNFFQAS